MVDNLNIYSDPSLAMYLENLLKPTVEPVGARPVAAVESPQMLSSNAAPTTIPTPAPAAPNPQEAIRKQLLDTANQKFGVNYGEKIISDNLLDNTINQILNEQRTNATSYLDRGKARGIYNDKGYAAGLGEVNNRSSAARSNLFSLASGVIDKYQGQADKVRDQAYSFASSNNATPDFNFDELLGKGSQIANNANTYAEGDLRGAIGNTDFFDTGALNNRAGQAQGAINLRNTDVATALAERKRRDGQPRGLGSQGVF